MTTFRHDAWQAGDSYDAYMGRWSRAIAPLFLDRLAVPPGLDWLDVGCGTGALSRSILDRCAPRSVLGVDASEGFVAHAQAAVADRRASFRVADAQSLPLDSDSVDLAVSALALNFVPDMGRALAEMRRVCRPGGKISFYVWDYPGGGVGFMRAFWQAATSLDSDAADLTEDRRFAFCEPAALTERARAAGLAGVFCAAIEPASVFSDFEDFWRPFTLGAGPAPGYCTSLAPEARDRLRETLRASLACRADGAIVLPLRAWHVEGRVV